MDEQGRHFQNPAAEADGQVAPLTSEGPSDEQLVQLAKQGDFDAFDTLATRHQERLYRLGIRMLRNEQDAQEVVQESLLSAWKNLAKFESKSQFGSWIYRIAANAALMMLRTRRRHPEAPLEEAGLGESDEVPAGTTVTDWSKRPDTEFQSSELRAHIQAAVDALPEQSRVVFVLRDVEEMSTEETAELLHLSVPAVKTRLHRARLILREEIGRYFDAH